MGWCLGQERVQKGQVEACGSSVPPGRPETVLGRGPPALWGPQSLVGEMGIKTPQSVIDVSYRGRRIRCSERSREAEGL